MTMECSSLSDFGVTTTGGVADVLPAEARAGVLPGAAGETADGVCGAVITGFVWGGVTGGLGAKNLTHRRITNMESSEAPRILISGESLSFCCGRLTNAPRPEPDRSQICERTDDSAPDVLCPTRRHAPIQSARWLHRCNGNRWDQSDNLPQTQRTSTLYKIAERKARF